MGRGAAEVDRARRARTSIADQARRTTCRRRAPTGPDAIGRQRPVHHADRRQGAGCSRRPGWPTGRCRRTTSRRSRRSATRSTASRPTRPARCSRARTTRYNPSGDEPARGLPVRVHHLPADRAPHRRRDEPHGCPTCPSCSRSCSARSRRELAARARAGARGWATIVTARTAIEARVLVTERMRAAAASAAGSSHQVGLPYHWGRNGLATGDSANDLVGVTLDPNVHIQEQGGTCDIRPGRRPRGPALLGVRRGLPAPGRHRPCDRPARDARATTVIDGSTRCTARLDDPAARRRLRRPPAAHGLLHRHLGLHRLQGLRGGVQGVERGPRRRLRR